MKRIKVDITDPNNVFVHKGGARKGHRYVIFTVEIGIIPDWMING